ncbi:hypothetical protein BH24ACI4_BH24ACI4_16060 [soil metagenome]
MFWIGVTHGGAAMTALHAQAAARLAALGFLPEGRGYTAHLTIGRVKDPGRAKPRGLREPCTQCPLTAERPASQRSHSSGAGCLPAGRPTSPSCEYH